MADTDDTADFGDYAQNAREEIDVEMEAESFEVYDEDDSNPGVFSPIYLGEVLGERYLIQHKLGHGGSATVWMAHDLEEKRDVAIKVMKTGSWGDNEIRMQTQVLKDVQDDARLAFYEHIRMRELQEEISDSTSEWLTARPPRTAPIILEYDTHVPVSIKDWKTLEACNVGIHEALCYVEEQSRTEMHYYFKATKRPGKRDLLHTAFHRGSPEGVISILVDFSSTICINEWVLDLLVNRLSRVLAVSTGSWHYRQMSAVEDATTWRLKWFKQHIAQASWPFFLASYRHQRLKFNNQTQKFMNDREVEERERMEGEKQQVPEVDSDVDSSRFFYKRRDSPLGRHYDLQFLPGNAHYGP